ncbi:MAG: hypothetical protein AB7P20_23115 [Rhizobiaceae bacterium]
MFKRSLQETLTGGSVRRITPVPSGAAIGLAAEVYAQARNEFALVPPLTIHSVVPEILAGVWCLTREAFVVGRAGRGARETVAAAVSKSNECPFCLDVHSAMLHAARDHRLAAQLQHGEGTTDSALVAWALATRTRNADELRHPPFALADAPQFIGTAVLFHFINRMVNIFLDRSPLPIEPRSATAKNILGRIFGSVLGARIVNVDVAPGESLRLLPDANLPTEFSWALPAPAIAGALARFNHAIEVAGVRALPESVRKLVCAHVSEWNGDHAPASRNWADRAVEDLVDRREQMMARLALLAAIGSFQVSDSDIVRVREHRTSDAELLTVAAWGSLQAARRLAGWIDVTASTEPLAERGQLPDWMGRH